MILRGLEVGPFASNCYVVGCEQAREALIIDPGADAKRILDILKRDSLTAKLIVATHGHLDHVNAVGEVKEATGASFAIHEAEVEVNSSRTASGLSAMLGLRHNPPPRPDRLLVGGDTIEVGLLRFTVLDTPGHSPGGISLSGHGVVFTGDTLFNFGIGRFDMPGCSYARLMDGIMTKLMALPDETRVYPGHGPETTIGTERQWNPFLRGDASPFPPGVGLT